MAQLLQCEATDARTCAERRRDRIPAAVRMLWRAAVGASVSRSAALRAETARQFRAFVATRQRSKLRQAVREGRALFRDPALCPLRGLTMRGDARESDAALVGPAVLAKFSASWRAHHLAATEVIRGFLSSGQGSAVAFTPSEASDSWARIARRTLCDPSGLCVEHLRALSEARPTPFPAWLSQAAGSDRFWASQAVEGRV